MKTKHRAKSDAVLPRELAGDFPEPVGPTAARQHELAGARIAARRQHEADRDVYRKEILGVFPDDKYAGGPVPETFTNPGPTAGEHIITKDPDRGFKIMGIDYARGADQSCVGKHHKKNDDTYATKIVNRTIRDEFPVTIEADCPCGRHLNVWVPRGLIVPPVGSLRPF